MEYKLRLRVRGALGFLGLFALTFLLWLFFRSYLFILALVFIPLFSLASVLLLWNFRGRLHAELILPTEKVGKGMEVPLVVRIFHSGKFVSFPAELTYSVCNVFTGYRERRRERVLAAPAGNGLCSSLASQYAGCVSARVEEFVVYDPLGLSALYGCDSTDAELMVWPDFAEDVDAEELYSCVDGFPKERENQGQGTELDPDYEVREYVPGDPLKSIHWKLSAKLDKVMVRKRLSTGRERINVLLPLVDDREQNDRLIESLLGLGRLLLAEDYPVWLFYPEGDEGLSACAIEGTGELDAAVARILSVDGNHYPGSAEERMAAEHPGEAYILVQTGAYKGAYIR